MSRIKMAQVEVGNIPIRSFTLEAICQVDLFFPLIIMPKTVVYVGLLVGWFRHILPKSALQVDEEAWNAYPYTRTRYTCPFVSNFSLDIETRYYDDSGSRENVFELSGTELRDRIIGEALTEIYNRMKWQRFSNLRLFKFVSV